MPRVVSLIASATEIVCGLGMRQSLVGRSHECDWPAEVLALPQLTEAKFKVEGSSADIDQRVQEIVRDGLSVYRVHGEEMRALDPDVIVTQDHCDVCAVSLSDVEAATCTWTGRPVRIVSLRPDSLADVYEDIGRVAQALDAPAAGQRLVAEMKARFGAVAARVAGRPRPRVAFVEWVEPMMAGGNWMPQLVEIAGGENLFGAHGKRSDWMQWEDLRAADPRRDRGRALWLRSAAVPSGAASASGARRVGAGEGRARGPRLFCGRERVLQSAGSAACGERGNAGRDATSGSCDTPSAAWTRAG